MSYVTDELYKYTPEYAALHANTSYLRRYIFKPTQEITEPDGSFSFIESNKLYDFDDDKFDKLETEEERLEYAKQHPDIRTYFKYNSIKGRFLNKDVKVCNLPTEILKVNGECPVCKLSKDIDIEDHISGESTNTDGSIPLKDIFGKQYSRDDFHKKTDTLVSIYIMKKFDNKYITHLLDPSSINVSILSSNYFEVTFTDNSNDFVYYIIEISKISPYDNYSYNSYNYIDFCRDDLSKNNFSILPDNIANAANIKREYIIRYDKNYGLIINANSASANGKLKKYSFGFVFKKNQKVVINKNNISLWYAYYDTNKKVVVPYLIPNSEFDISYYTYNNEYMRVSIDPKANSNFNELVVEAYFNIENHNNNEHYLHRLIMIISGYEPIYSEDSLRDVIDNAKFNDRTYIRDSITDPSMEDENFEEEIIEYYPYWFRKQLEAQCNKYEYKIDTINRSDLIYLLPDDSKPNENKYIPCLRFEVPIKHASFMLFHYGELLSPYAYFEGEHTLYVQNKGGNITIGSSGNMYIYINIRDIDEYAYTAAVKNNYKKIVLNQPIYLVTNTDTFFNEDVIYPLQKVDRYICTVEPSGIERPIEFDKVDGVLKMGTIATEFDENGGATFLEYIPLESEDRYYIRKIDTGLKDDSGNVIYDIKYELDYTAIGLHGKSYYVKAVSKDYILPPNKNLDEKRVSIVAEQMLEFDENETIADSVTGLKYGKANYGSYVCLYHMDVDGNKSDFRFARYDVLTDEEIDHGMIVLDGIYFLIEGGPKETNYIQRYKRASYHYSTILDDLSFYKENHKSNLTSSIDKDSAYTLKKFNDELRVTINYDNDGIMNCQYVSPSDYINLINIDEASELSQYSVDSDTNMVDINNCKLYAYATDNGYSRYILNDETEQFLAYQLPNQLMASDNKLFGFIDGKLTDQFIVDKHLYYKLFDGDTILAFSDDPVLEDGNDDKTHYVYNPNGDYVYDTAEDIYRKDNGSELDKTYDHYDRIISTVYITNPGNYSLYRDAEPTGINIYKSKIFELKNDYICPCVYNKNKKCKEYWMLPFSTKYMMLFINGRYIPSDYIEVLSNRRFMLKGLAYDGFFDSSDFIDVGGYKILNIRSMAIYVYDYIDPTKYEDYYTTTKTVIEGDEVIIHELSDPLWNKCISPDVSNYMTNTYGIDVFNWGNPYYQTVQVNCEPTAFYKDNITPGMYEIFGKYVLNKYDIDGTNDAMLLSEIRTYFDAIYDDDDRLPLNLILDKIKRKYTY